MVAPAVVLLQPGLRPSLQPSLGGPMTPLMLAELDLFNPLLPALECKKSGNSTNHRCLISLFTKLLQREFRFEIEGSCNSKPQRTARLVRRICDVVIFEIRFHFIRWVISFRNNG